MKKIFFPVLLIALLFTACGGNAPVVEEPIVDEAATVVAEVLYATQTAMAAEAEKEAVQVIDVPEENSVPLNTDYTDAAPVHTQLIVGLLKLKDTGQAVTADQASTLLSVLSSLANLTPENSLTEDSINEMINQAISVLSAEQIQTISDMQITDASAMTVLQDLGLEMGGKDADEQPAEGGPGMGGPGGEGGEPPAGNSDNPGNPVNPGEGGEGGNPGEGGPGGVGAPGEVPAGDQEMNRGIMIQPQLMQALIEYLQSVSA